jgi:hypothetical protein
MANLANATAVAKGTRGSVQAKVIGGAILLVILLQFMVIPQNGNVSIPVRRRPRPRRAESDPRFHPLTVR